MKKTENKLPNLLVAMSPILFLIVMLAVNVMTFDDPIAGSSQVALMFATVITVLIAKAYKCRWSRIESYILKMINASMPSMLILLLIGALAGTWMISGVVPTLIYYGLDMINPKIFLITAVVVSAVISVSTGSSWSTIATIGVALLGIGKALGFDEAVVAGAIISGAYFGDKMSPLSDTTNLAPAMAGTDLFSHIKYMMYTTIPTLIITVIIFLFIGFGTDISGTADIASVQNTLAETFFISPILLLVPVILIIIILKKIAPIPSLMISVLSAIIFAVIFQPEVINSLYTGDSHNYFMSAYQVTLEAIFGEISFITESAMINDLLTTSGMQGMLNTVWLILSAMVFGGALEAGGFIKVISSFIIKFANSTISLVATTIGTCTFFNIAVSDQYLSIVVPGKMYSDIYKEKGLRPELLSRALEDSGTVVSVLIPWNTCGATQAQVLGVPTLTYLPYCFFNLISPLMSIAVAVLFPKHCMQLGETKVELAEDSKE